MKMTKQRKVILEVLRKTDSHPSADKIYEDVRKKIPDVSLGTIYRNLDKLSESGHILKLDKGLGQRRYDGNTHPHYHMVCKACCQIFDVPENVEISVDFDEEELDGFNVNDYVFMLRGTCSRCISEKKRSKNYET